MITVSVKDIMQSQSAFKKIANASLKAATAYKIARIIKELESELNTEQGVAMKLIEKYGARDENNKLISNESGNFIIRTDCTNEYTEELDKLLQTMVDINCDYLNMADIKEIIISPSEMISLIPFIKE